MWSGTFNVIIVFVPFIHIKILLRCFTKFSYVNLRKKKASLGLIYIFSKRSEKYFCFNNEAIIARR